MYGGQPQQFGQPGMPGAMPGGPPVYSYSPPVHPNEQAKAGEPGSPAPAAAQMPMGAPPMGFPGAPMGFPGAGFPGAGFHAPGQAPPLPNMFANLVPGMAQMQGGHPGVPPPFFGHPGVPQFAATAPGQPAAPYSMAPPGYQQPFMQPPAAPAVPGQPQPSFSYVPPQPAQQQYMQQPGYAPAQQAPMTRVVQHTGQPQPQPQQPAVEKILVSISGRDGVNDVINGTFNSIGEHGGRYSFTKPTNEGPIYLYYDQASDNWCVGDQIGSQSYYAVCGPSNGQDMAQQWRVWTGEEWEVDPKMQATIH